MIEIRFPVFLLLTFINFCHLWALQIATPYDDALGKDAETNIGISIEPDSLIKTEEEIIVIEAPAENICGLASESNNETAPVSLSSLQYPRSQKNPYKFHATELIVPGTLIAVGSVGLTKWWKQHVNEPVKNKLQGEGHKKVGIDNVLMLLPAVTGYGMNLFGFKGKHDIVDATIIYATAFLLTEAATLTVKYTVHSPRPNEKNNMSFLSGHTANAFCGAELLRREYWDVSPWIGVGGYAVAAATGFMRLYNNAHWLNDVIAGAGVGILCAEAAYWLYPVITKAFFKKSSSKNIFLSPTASTTHVGIAFSASF